MQKAIFVAQMQFDFSFFCCIVTIPALTSSFYMGIRYLISQTSILKLFFFKLCTMVRHKKPLKQILVIYHVYLRGGISASLIEA